MNFCFINMPIEFYSPTTGGAISTIIAETTRELVALGNQVDVLTKLDNSPTHCFGRVVPLRWPTRAEVGFVRWKASAIKRQLNGWDWPDYGYYVRAVLHATRDAAYDAIIVFNDLVTPRYLHRQAPDSVICSWLQNEWRTNQRSMSQTLAATDRFLACSDAIREWTIETHAVPAERIRTLHSGVNLETFSPPSGDVSTDGSLRVLFVGRIDPNKGPDVAARAVRALRDEGLAATFTVAGGIWFFAGAGHAEDPYLRGLSELVRAVDGTMLGHVTRDAVPDVYRAHDVVCVLSRSREPFGLVALEAMASGCAVVASNRGGLPETCGGAATLVNPDDLPAVVAQLRLWATDRAALAVAKRRCRSRAERSSWSVVARELIATITESRAGRVEREAVVR